MATGGGRGSGVGWGWGREGGEGQGEDNDADPDPNEPTPDPTVELPLPEIRLLLVRLDQGERRPPRRRPRAQGREGRGGRVDDGRRLHARAARAPPLGQPGRHRARGAAQDEGVGEGALAVEQAVQEAGGGFSL